MKPSIFNSKQAKEKLLNSKNEVDFKNLALKMGYVKARKLLKNADVQAHQAVIDSADAELILKKKPARMDYFSKIGLTAGEPNLENPVDKILNNSTASNSRAKGGNEDREFDVELSLIRSLATEELILPQMGVERLPIGLGDTLFLQV